MSNRAGGMWCADGRRKSDHATFSDDAIKSYIPRICLDFLDCLTVECEADELRMQPVRTVSEERETAIEVAAAHTDTIAEFVECDEWSEYEIDPPRRDKRSRDGLPEPEKVSFEASVGGDLPEDHASATVDDRGENALFCAPGARDDGARVDLIVAGQIARDRVTGGELARPDECVCYPR